MLANDTWECAVDMYVLLCSDDVEAEKKVPLEEEKIGLRYSTPLFFLRLNLLHCSA
jgi:predicted dinucleotide-binding enzyme